MHFRQAIGDFEKETQTGVAQIMVDTLVSALANLRRINTPINREGSQTQDASSYKLGDCMPCRDPEEDRGL